MYHLPRSRSSVFRLSRWGFVLVVVLAVSPTAWAQLNVGGVILHPDGMVRDAVIGEISEGELENLKPATPDLTKSSPLRVISLRALEASLPTNPDTIPIPDQRFLAGLTAVRIVRFDPETGDVLIAGPAEPWKRLPTGQVVGVDSGRATLRLDDLHLALTAALTERPAEFLGCSIEPTAEGMAAYAGLVRKIRRIDPRTTDRLRSVMEQTMGPQAVKVYGVPTDSRLAAVMVAADYRLKRLAMGFDPPPVSGFRNYLSIKAARVTSPAGARLQSRFWLEAGFEELRQSPDGHTFEFLGRGLTVVTAPTLPNDSSGKAVPSPPEATAFVEGMTAKLPELARAVPVFSELENQVGLVLAAVLLRRHLDRAIETDAVPRWRPNRLLEGDLAETHPVPSRVPSLATVQRTPRGVWLLSVSGGVAFNPWTATEKIPPRPASDPPPDLVRRPNTPVRWWWDG